MFPNTKKSKKAFVGRLQQSDAGVSRKNTILPSLRSRRKVVMCRRDGMLFFHSGAPVCGRLKGLILTDRLHVI